MNNPENVKRSLESRTLKVCVVGIGRIGLPTALSFAKSGLETVGVDINEILVENVNSGIFPLKDEPGYEEIFDDVMKSNKFSATTKIEDAIPISDLILLSLPTPMDENNIPDYSALQNVGEKLSKILSEKIENSQDDEILQLNNRKKELLQQLDDLLLETFQTSDVLIDEQRLVNGEEGCLCNIDLEQLEGDSKHGLFDLDLINSEYQHKIESRINQILRVIED